MSFPYPYRGQGFRQNRQNGENALLIVSDSQVLVRTVLFVIGVHSGD